MGSIVGGSVALGMMPPVAALPALFAGMPADVPVDPDAAQARQWLIRELTKPEYQAAKPNWFDRASSAVWDWVRSLDLSHVGAAQVPILVLIAVLVVGVVVAAFFVFGAPRLNRRSVQPGALFGGDDRRDAAALRQAAERAAAHAAWAEAITDMFRAISRGLAERTILGTSPGTTARSFAGRAAAVFPELAGRLSSAAHSFDRVRYLGRPGSAEAYRRMAELEQALRQARPALSRAAGQ